MKIHFTLLVSFSILFSTFFSSCSNSSSPTAPGISSEISSSENSSSSTQNSSTTLSSNAETSSQSNLSSNASSATASVGPWDDMSKADGNLSYGDGLWIGDADLYSGGSSDLLDMNGNSLVTPLVGCGDDGTLNGDPCYSGWNVQTGKAYVDGALTALLKVKDWVPSSADTWGWSSAGWILQPKGGATDTLNAGLQSSDTLILILQYPKEEALNIELIPTPDIFNPSTASPMRYMGKVGGYLGTGTKDTLILPLSKFSASWGDDLFTAEDTWRIGINRQITASVEGEDFPVATESTLLKIWCVGLGLSCLK